jgi:3'(2'), 5'-bisphosphate nucleotidase
MKQLLEKAIQAAIEAGKAIMEVYATEFDIETKEDNSPLTRADTRANEIITRMLEPSNLPVVSEEGKSIPYHKRETWQRFWLIDPLDGTKEFINRNNEFTVNIALIDQGMPVMGIVYAPVMDLLYFSDQHGAWKKEQASADTLLLSDADNLKPVSLRLPLSNHSSGYTIVASRSHLNAQTTTFINQVKREHSEIRIISRGSSLKLCMIAEGLADVYPRFGITSEWDIAAGHALIIAAGGKVVSAEGNNELSYNTPGMENPPFIAYAATSNA